MFTRTETSPKPGNYESLFGKSLEVKGEIKSTGSLRLEGSVEGSVESQSDVSVGDRAVVTADITAQNVTIAGTVNGNINCSGKAELLPTARVKGNILAGILVVSEGASILGELKVNREAGTGAQGKEGLPGTKRVNETPVSRGK